MVAALGASTYEIDELTQLCIIGSKQPGHDVDLQIAQIFDKLNYYALYNEMRSANYLSFLRARKKLASTWPEGSFELTHTSTNKRHWQLIVHDAIKDLSPLRGMPITSLTLRDSSNLTHFNALRKSPLRTLVLHDADQLKGLNDLQSLRLTRRAISRRTAKPHWPSGIAFAGIISR